MFWSFILYAAITSITPGPNNVMVTACGVNFGFRKTLPAILGVGFGFSVMVFMVGLGAGSLLGTSGPLFETIRWLGIAYLLYLAYGLATAGAAKLDSTVVKPWGFLPAALFQWVNPKAWIMIAGAVVVYTNPQSGVMTYLMIAALYALIGIPCVAAWAVMGDALRHVLSDSRKMRWFNLAMAALLVWSVLGSVKESLGWA
ncbi:LysE family translocator [Mesopusillimonas faecipullorum]|nr:LysE family translocator [Mesopusillimonas faecipullorum]